MLGIIPAGGLATRFGGVPKDLLPTGEGRTLLSDTLARGRAMGCREFVVVTSAEKAGMHERALCGTATLLVSSGAGLWAAIAAALVVPSDALLLLPDTVFTPLEPVPLAPLAFGVFPTAQPERFSVVTEDGIVTKRAGAPGYAWGCVAWRAEVGAWMRARAWATYDEAFSAAMRVFGHQTFAISGYEDFGAWAQYQAYVRAI